MRKIIILAVMSFCISNVQAQLFKKLKDKVNQSAKSVTTKVKTKAETAPDRVIVDDNGLIAFDIDPNQTNLGYANSTTATLSLKKSASANDADLIRSSFAINGGKLRVYFRPKAILLGYDDWKIKNITIDFMFTDQYGKAYPEKILFECKDVNLGRDSRALECWFDGGFKAGSVFTTQ